PSLFHARPSFPWLALRSIARRELRISCPNRKPRTVVRLFSHIPASGYRFRARLEAKARPFETREGAKAKTPAITPPIPGATRAANLLSSNPLRVPRDLLD